MAKIQPKAFVQVENAISKTILKTYNKKRNTYAAKISRQLSKGDFDGALETAHSANLNGVYWSNRKRLRLLSQASVRFGQTRLADSKDIIYDVEGDELLKKSLDLLNLSIKGAEKHIEKSAQLHIEKLAVKENASKAEKVREFVSFIDDTAGAVGQNHLQLVSSLHNSRLAQYGFTVEANIRAIQFYAINAVLDGRTSDICKYMHGKVFPVEYAYEQSLKLLGTEDPDELKHLAPWATNSGSFEAMQGMNTGELMNAGWALPPFHPHCRTYIDEAGNTVDVDFELGEVEVTVPATSNQSAKPPLADETAENTLLQDFNMSLSDIGATSGIAKIISDDVDIQEATNLWSMIPNVTMLELEAIIVAIRSGDYDDFELMELFGLSFTELKLIKDTL